jgi:hypothetical protein
VIKRLVLRGYLTAACQTKAMTILFIAKCFRGFMPPWRNQKLLPHLGEAGTTVFAVEEVE